MRGESFYLQQPAVIDGDLITASGVAPLDFAYAILNKLEVFLPATLEAWYKLYQTHEAKYFFALMASLPRSPEGNGDGRGVSCNTHR